MLAPEFNKWVDAFTRIGLLGDGSSKLLFEETQRAIESGDESVKVPIPSKTQPPSNNQEADDTDSDLVNSISASMTSPGQKIKVGSPKGKRNASPPRNYSNKGSRLPSKEDLDLSDSISMASTATPSEDGLFSRRLMKFDSSGTREFQRLGQRQEQLEEQLEDEKGQLANIKEQMAEELDDQQKKMQKEEKERKRKELEDLYGDEAERKRREEAERKRAQEQQAERKRKEEETQRKKEEEEAERKKQEEQASIAIQSRYRGNRDRAAMAEKEAGRKNIDEEEVKGKEEATLQGADKPEVGPGLPQGKPKSVNLKKKKPSEKSTKKDGEEVSLGTGIPKGPAFKALEQKTAAKVDESEPIGPGIPHMR